MLWIKLLKLEGCCGIYSKCDVELRIPDKGFISTYILASIITITWLSLSYVPVGEDTDVMCSLTLR
jgi:hypothetical protein